MAAALVAEAAETPTSQLLQSPTGRDDYAGIDNGTGFMRIARAVPGVAKPFTDCVQRWEGTWRGAVGAPVPIAP